MPPTRSPGSPRQDLERRIAEFGLRCSSEGKPLTPQRREILGVLCGRSDHPTVEDIHVEVARRLPGVSRATVYRTLETLVQMGLAARVSHSGMAARFDPRTDRHHHFLCETCGSISDVEDEGGMRDLRPPTPGARVRDYTVVLLGECRDCRELSLVRGRVRGTSPSS